MVWKMKMKKRMLEKYDPTSAIATWVLQNFGVKIKNEDAIEIYLLFSHLLAKDQQSLKHLMKLMRVSTKNYLHSKNLACER